MSKPPRTDLETAVIAWERANRAVDKYRSAGAEWTNLLSAQMTAEAELRKQARALMGRAK